MTQFGSMAARRDIGRRLCRLPLVLLVTVSLLFSLLHCATFDLDVDNVDGRWRSLAWTGLRRPTCPSICCPAITAFLTLRLSN